MSKYSRYTAWTIVGGYIAQIAASIVLGSVLLARPWTGLTLFLVAALGLFIATRMRGLNNIVHECSHATFTEDRHDNTLMGSVCASVVMGCFKDYRDEHMTHHAHLGDYDHDLDLQGLKGLRLHEPLTPRNLLRHLINPLLLRHLPYYLHINMSARDGAGFMALKLGLLAATGIFALINPVAALIMVILPFGLGYSTINYWTDCLDHAGICQSEEEIDSSRNILAPGPLRVLLFPRNDCFHLVHHLFPQIPARHLPASHKMLCDEEVYSSRRNANRHGTKPTERYPEASSPAQT